MRVFPELPTRNTGTQHGWRCLRCCKRAAWWAPGRAADEVEVCSEQKSHAGSGQVGQLLRAGAGFGFHKEIYEMQRSAWPWRVPCAMRSPTAQQERRVSFLVSVQDLRGEDTTYVPSSRFNALILNKTFVGFQPQSGDALLPKSCVI